jgi:leucyl-tRNA synthetase
MRLTASVDSGEGPPIFRTNGGFRQTMTSERYNPRVAEPRWQAAWAERRIFETPNEDPRPKYYVLEMFPYP